MECPSSVNARPCPSSVDFPAGSSVPEQCDVYYPPANATEDDSSGGIGSSISDLFGLSFGWKRADFSWMLFAGIVLAAVTAMM